MNNRIPYFIYGSFLILLYIVYLWFTPTYGHEYDLWRFGDWAVQIHNSGLGEVYLSGTGYPPLYHYILTVFAWAKGDSEAIYVQIYQLKYITLVFDFIAGLVICALAYRHAQNFQNAAIKSLFYMLNLFVLYNTIIWGQVDSILACLIFISFYTAYRSQTTLAAILFLLALNFKIQAIVFMPFIALITIPQIFVKFKIRDYVVFTAVLAIIQIIILIPFINSGHVDMVMDAVFTSADRHISVSLNAYNVWELLLQGDLISIQDSNEFMMLTYKQWGLMMFFAFSVIALLPLCRQVIHDLKARKASELDLEKLLITGFFIRTTFLLPEYPNARAICSYSFNFSYHLFSIVQKAHLENRSFHCLLSKP